MACSQPLFKKIKIKIKKIEKKRKEKEEEEEVDHSFFSFTLKSAFVSLHHRLPPATRQPLVFSDSIR